MTHIYLSLFLLHEGRTMTRPAILQSIFVQSLLKLICIQNNNTGQMHHINHFAWYKHNCLCIWKKLLVVVLCHLPFFLFLFSFFSSWPSKTFWKTFWPSIDPQTCVTLTGLEGFDLFFFCTVRRAGISSGDVGVQGRKN